MKKTSLPTVHKDFKNSSFFKITLNGPFKRKTIIRFIYTFILCCIGTAYAKTVEYGPKLCHQPKYKCLKIERDNSWSQLFPNEKQRELVKRINRTNEFLESGMIIAVPKDINNKTLFDFSPFPLSIKAPLEKTIIVDLTQLAWGAFNEKGLLLKWGPISAGTAHCVESDKGCLTPTGTFYIQSKKGEECFSKSLPKTIFGESGGAFMPYCMYFFQGYALHGSKSLPGYHASHGCVRLFIDDAKWLNEFFVVSKKKHIHGTKVLIKN